VLHQGAGPVAFFSKPIAPRHAKLATYERELIGLVHTVRHWRPYLWGHTFLIRTDHFNLKFLLDQRLNTVPQHQWARKLLGVDFTVDYKPDTTNVVADALSRCGAKTDATLCVLSAPTFRLFDDLRQEFASSTDLCQLMEVTAGSRGDKWQVHDGLVTVAGQVFVHVSSPSLPAILAEVHNMGHEGVAKSLHQLRSNFYVPHAKQVMQDFVRACAICLRDKVEHLHPARLLQPLGVPTMVWADVAMDFIEGFPASMVNLSFSQ
jgi:hypothetical protein